jgi:glycosyltransferase involved in cell wall biosynthesis
MEPDHLRILYAGSLPPLRHGLAIMCGQLVARLAERGHQVRAISPIMHEELRNGDAFASAHPRVRVTRMLVPSIHDPSRAPAAYRRDLGEGFRRAVDAQVAAARPDVLFIGNTSMAEYLLDLTIAHQIPCVLRLGGPIALQILDGTLPEDLGREVLAGLRRADRLVAVAPHLAGALRLLGLDHVGVIENPVDTRRFSPGAKDPGLMEALAVAADDVVVAHVSKLAPEKRPLDIVLSAERALRSNPRLLYLIVGDGALRPAMEDACARNGLTGRFRFVGWVDHATVPGYLNLADVVVMPSEPLEGRSNVYLETQACGRVLLASDIPAAREVIVDGETGLLFRKGDVTHLTARTLELGGDQSLRAAIGVRARQVSEGRAFDSVLAAYENVFREVIRQRDPRGRGR